jgi:hypothetical protein
VQPEEEKFRPASLSLADSYAVCVLVTLTGIANPELLLLISIPEQCSDCCIITGIGRIRGTVGNEAGRSLYHVSLYALAYLRLHHTETLLAWINMCSR